MDISIETLLSRTSVRTYDGTPLSPDEVVSLRKAFLDCSIGPFGGKPRFTLVGPEVEGSSGTGKVGSYGIVRNAPAYILGVIERGPFAFEDFGYCMEGIILSATALGLGTCWLGGTFDRKAAVRTLAATKDEIVPAMSPVGHATPRRGAVDSLIRMSAGSSGRRPWAELFFSGSFNMLLPNGEDSWSVVLKCVQRGPSASNKQPWRIVRDDTSEKPRFHLYLQEDKTYNHAMGELRPQNIDMGIAIMNFEAAAHALGLPGAWKRLEQDPLTAEAPLSYIASFIAG
jgi:nitroreductase